jgi:hypothetical protein
MGEVLLSLHVLAAILTIGPVTVAASMFPRHAKALAGADPAAAGHTVTTLRTLHRISRVYAVLGIAVPVLGVGVAARLGVLGDAWLVVSIALTAVAAVLLVARVLPGQEAVLAAAPAPDLARARALSMTTGIFALLWAVVVVLMVVRPGSTTGV